MGEYGCIKYQKAALCGFLDLGVHFNLDAKGLRSDHFHQSLILKKRLV